LPGRERIKRQEFVKPAKKLWGAQRGQGKGCGGKKKKRGFGLGDGKKKQMVCGGSGGDPTEGDQIPNPLQKRGAGLRESKRKKTVPPFKIPCTWGNHRKGKFSHKKTTPHQAKSWERSVARGTPKENETWGPAKKKKKNGGGWGGGDKNLGGDNPHKKFGQTGTPLTETAHPRKKIRPHLVPLP